MTMKELKIEIPEGHEIDTERSTFERIVFRPVKSTLPKTWEDIGDLPGYYVNSESVVRKIPASTTEKNINRNVFAEKDQAEAAIALAQLSQLKKVHNGDWVPDWNSVVQAKYVIMPYRDIIATSTNTLSTAFLSFKDAETRDLFLENFRDLIEQAKPLMS